MFDAIIEDPRIAAGTFILGDLSNYNVDFYGDIIVKIGYINDDLIRNQFTVVVEQFFFQYISTNKLGGIGKRNILYNQNSIRNTIIKTYDSKRRQRPSIIRKYR
jgi:hypothetical protein